MVHKSHLRFFASHALSQKLDLALVVPQVLALVAGDEHLLILALFYPCTFVHQAHGPFSIRWARIPSIFRWQRPPTQ